MAEIIYLLETKTKLKENINRYVLSHLIYITLIVCSDTHTINLIKCKSISPVNQNTLEKSMRRKVVYFLFLFTSLFYRCNMFWARIRQSVGKSKIIFSIPVRT